MYHVFMLGLFAHPNHFRDPPRLEIRAPEVQSNRACLVMACYITAVCTDTGSGIKDTCRYRVIKNYCRGFNNLSYTIHLRWECVVAPTDQEILFSFMMCGVQ